MTSSGWKGPRKVPTEKRRHRQGAYLVLTGPRAAPTGARLHLGRPDWHEDSPEGHYEAVSAEQAADRRAKHWREM